MAQHRLEVLQATDTAVLSPEGVATGLVAELGRTMIRTFQEHLIPGRDHQLPDVEEGKGHIHTHGHHLEHHLGEEEVRPHHEVLREGDGEALATALTVATAAVEVGLGAGQEAGVATVEEDDILQSLVMRVKGRREEIK